MNTAAPPDAASLVRIELQGQVGIITMDHAARRNALGAEMVGALLAALAGFGQRKVRAVVLRAAAGSRVWSAGHDVDELPTSGRDPLGWDDPLRLLVREIEQCPAPVIAMVDGSVWGGACETVFACDIVIASPAATFTLTPARLGVPYNIGGMVTLLNASNLRIAKEMVFTARPVEADRAERLGLVNHVVAADELEAFCLEMARDIAANAPLSISVMKEQLRILAGARPMSPQGFERIQGLRRLVYDSADYREGISAFKQRRPPLFNGA